MLTYPTRDAAKAAILTLDIQVGDLVRTGRTRYGGARGPEMVGYVSAVFDRLALAPLTGYILTVLLSDRNIEAPVSECEKLPVEAPPPDAGLPTLGVRVESLEARVEMLETRVKTLDWELTEERDNVRALRDALEALEHRFEQHIAHLY